MNEDSAFSVVVLPDPVPPLTRTFSRARTAAASSSRSGADHVPTATRSSGVKPARRKRRIVSTGPSTASGGMMTLTREPSGSRASTSGSASSTRRPSGARMRSIACRRSASVSNATPASSIRPARSTKTEPGPLTITSSTVASRSSGSSAPSPKDRSTTRPTRSSRVSGSSTPASRSTSARMRAWRSPSSPAPASRTSRSRSAAARPSSSSLTRPVGRRGAMFAPRRPSRRRRWNRLRAGCAIRWLGGSGHSGPAAGRLRASRSTPATRGGRSPSVSGNGDHGSTHSRAVRPPGRFATFR